MYEFDIEMPDKYKELMLKTVKASRVEKTLTGYWYAGAEFACTIVMGKGRADFKDVVGMPFESFDCLGFVNVYRENFGYGVRPPKITLFCCRKHSNGLIIKINHLSVSLSNGIYQDIRTGFLFFLLWYPLYYLFSRCFIS